MTDTSPLFTLFEVEAEPSATPYKDATNDTIRNPELIQDLKDDRVKVHLSTRTKRFTEFFRYLRSSLPPPKSQKLNDIAAATSKMLAQLLPELHLLLGSVGVIKPLVSALLICLASPQPVGMRNLASVLCDCDRTLEFLVAEPSGSEVLRRWVGLPRTLAFDVPTQTSWTARLVNMVLSCRGDHGIALTVQRWNNLADLREALQNMDQRLLREESTKAAALETRNHSFSIFQNDFKDRLAAFGLTVPGSRRMVQNHIQTLSDGATSSVLCSVVLSFPCKYCTSGLGGPLLPVNTGLENEFTEAASDLSIDVLGKQLGVWKILLSENALKSLQKTGIHGVSGPVHEKLIDLASGYISSKLAGSPTQREHLRVPLATTSCGRNLSILWQVSTRNVGAMQKQQQVMIVWDIGDPTTISKALDRVIVLQRSYSDEEVQRCRIRPSTLGGKSLPIQFDNQISRSANLGEPTTRLDVRTVDPETVQLANKFYAFTEPVMNSILTNDLAAEFPFDLSMSEALCIKHYKSSSLIMGRSGTGKTTCLVFKLVGKFLASKALPGEKPAHQVGNE